MKLNTDPRGVEVQLQTAPGKRVASQAETAVCFNVEPMRGFYSEKVVISFEHYLFHTKQFGSERG